jgi:hypothetical protein
VHALLTDMDQVLGPHRGNALEVRESLDVLPRRHAASRGWSRSRSRWPAPRSSSPASTPTRNRR